MKLLVSMCNQDAEQAQLPGVFLFQLDTETQQVQPIPLEIAWPAGTGGIMGLAHHGDDIVAVTQGATALLVRLSRSYQVKDVWPLQLVKDAHSLAVVDDTAYIASTGTDAIVAFEPRRGERVFWRDNPGGLDTIHLNSVLWSKGSLHATAFGKKKGTDWRSAEDGYLLNLTTGQVLVGPLHHPHSATVIPERTQEGIYFCESQRMAVGRQDGQRLRVGSTYTRGLVVTASLICVGFSRGRLTSRSSNQPAGQCGWMPGKCGVQLYQRRDGALSDSQLLGTITLEAYSHEIYDLLPLGVSSAQ